MAPLRRNIHQGSKVFLIVALSSICIMRISSGFGSGWTAVRGPSELLPPCVQAAHQWER
jgi:hypothetical protein